jgi:hypothetical protein
MRVFVTGATGFIGRMLPPTRSSTSSGSPSTGASCVAPENLRPNGPTV